MKAPTRLEDSVLMTFPKLPPVTLQKMGGGVGKRGKTKHSGHSPGSDATKRKAGSKLAPNLVTNSSSRHK